MDQTHLALAIGKLVLQKITLKSIFKSAPLLTLTRSYMGCCTHLHLWVDSMGGNVRAGASLDPSQ